MERNAWPAVLDALNAKMPPGVWITQLTPAFDPKAASTPAPGARGPHAAPGHHPPGADQAAASAAPAVPGLGGYQTPTTQVNVLVINGLYHANEKTMQDGYAQLTELVSALADLPLFDIDKAKTSETLISFQTADTHPGYFAQGFSMHLKLKQTHRSHAMKNLSRFDIGMIIAFVVVALLGAAGWWWLSGELQTAMADANAAASDFSKYSEKEVFLPTKNNVKILQSNIDVMTGELDPIVAKRLQGPNNGLKGVHQVDTVDWKHDLDEDVSRLNASAATHGIIVPKNFYYGFSRYLSVNPAEEATAVLKRQEIAITALSNILIQAPVKAIISVKRTAEEDPEQTGSPSFTAGSNGTASSDILPGHSVDAPGDVYTTYPLEVEFDTDSESFHNVINKLMQSDYVFVLRSVLVQNSRIDSPQQRDLDALAGVTDATPAAGPSILGSPGAVGAATPATPTIGLQYLFGDETLHVRLMVDLVDWHGLAQPASAAGAHGKAHGANGAAGARNAAGHATGSANPNTPTNP